VREKIPSVNARIVAFRRRRSKKIEECLCGVYEIAVALNGFVQLFMEEDELGGICSNQCD
jgi:hypothetical protein